jgi:hypothetical protein
MKIRERLAHNLLYIGLSHASYRLLTRISPDATSRRRWKKIFGFPLREENPVWWDEKLMLLKMRDYNHNPLVRRCANKYAMREYVAQQGCGELLIDVYGLWNRVEDIPFDRLPDECVLKSTMGCGLNSHVFIGKREQVDVEKARSTLRAALKDRYYLDYAEMQYAPGRDYRPQIYCERRIGGGGTTPADIKVFCFHGRPEYILYCFNRDGEGHASYLFMDRSWTPRPDLHPCTPMEATPPKPACLQAMLDYAVQLSRPFPFVRVDFYDEDGTPRIGEMTFTPSACLDAEILEAGQIALGKLL